MLQLSFNVCQKSDCSTIEFTETTGLYDVTSNPTGWGTAFSTVNPDIDTFLYAKLEFFDSANNLVNTTTLFPEFPTTNKDFTKSLDIDLPDDLYKIVYTVSLTRTTGPVYTATVYQGFYCNSKCCVASMLKDIDLECGCLGEKLEKYNQAYALLQGLICAAECGNISQFNNILPMLNKICKNKKCRC